MSMESALTNGRIVTLDCHIRGIVPTIMSNGAMADPTFYWAKAAREIKKGVKRGEVMTEQDRRRTTTTHCLSDQLLPDMRQEHALLAGGERRRHDPPRGEEVKEGRSRQGGHHGGRQLPASL